LLLTLKEILVIEPMIIVANPSWVVDRGERRTTFKKKKEEDGP
jgi:hypothetical protein